jgi:hypothetical protein
VKVNMRRPTSFCRIFPRTSWEFKLRAHDIILNPVLSRIHHRTRLAPAFALGVALFWSVLAAAADTSWEADPYQLGQGLYFPQQGLRVGGYADLHYFGLDNHVKSSSVEDLSLFLTKDIGSRWKLFSETAIGEALTVTGHGASTADASLEIERLYADYYASSAATFRFGKFLTPVGQWNLVHADPLVWTVSRPLSTTAAFSRNATGAMIYGTRTFAHDDLDYTLYVDDTQAFGWVNDADTAYGSYGAAGAINPLTNEFERAAGGQVLYHMHGDQLSLGASFVGYELKDPRQKYRLAGLNFGWMGPHVELSAEGVYRTADRPQTPSEYGGYLQAVVPLPNQLFLVGRYEHFRNSTPNVIDNIWTIGINYRPVPGIVFRMERDDDNHDYSGMPSGWFASVAVLF